jgi:hypothetical protein
VTSPLSANIASPATTHEFLKGCLYRFDLAGFACVKVRYEPGFRWSESLGEGSTSCSVRHTGYALSGRLHVRMDDGTEAEVAGGELFVVPPGHDGWVVGDEAFEALDFAPEMARYFP